MPPILNAQGVSKAFGAAPLFQNVSFTVNEGDRIGLIGPNGSGKSTLLQIFAGRIPPDDGEVAWRKLARLAYVAQESEFAPGQTVRMVIEQALTRARVPDDEREGRLAETLGRAGFLDFDAEAVTLSGGWRKRLAIAEALVERPDVLLLDEPTNHLDLAAIEWLEELLVAAPFASVVVSHDRYFLENFATEVAELNRVFPDGMLRVEGSYTQFLEKKDEFLHAQTKRQEALENRVRTELEWLRRGPKARTTKSKARIDRANQMIDELSGMAARTRTAVARLDLAATDRQTKRLIELEDVRADVPGRTLFSGLDFLVTAGTRVGLVGPNGSGKTTLLRILKGDIAPANGTVRRAERLRIVHFDQNRELPADVTLARALAPDSDSVVHNGRTVHVASWASRFLFTGEQLNQPVSRLSGGERARILIARLMLEPADVLLLDEPTNDLDIQTLEVLEENLLEYSGALIMVTHDRFLLDRVSTVVLGLDGLGNVERFADYSQWDAWYRQQRQPERKIEAAAESRRESATSGRKKLSYLEAREYATIEARIAEAETALSACRAAFEDPSISTDAQRLLQAQAAFDLALNNVDQLYARWAELEEKQQ